MTTYITDWKNGMPVFSDRMGSSGMSFDFLGLDLHDPVIILLLIIVVLELVMLVIK